MIQMEGALARSPSTELRKHRAKAQMDKAKK